MQKELFSLFGNGHRENIIFSVSAGESVTCHFKDSGTNTTTNKYFDLRQPAHKVHIKPTVAATITHIDNQELDSPKTIPSGGLVFKDGIEWGSIVVRADAACTFEIYAS